MEGSGSYSLVMLAEKGHTLTVGRLGPCDFPAGYYVYAGSALGGLKGRLKRHLRSEKRLHWHIDYLLQLTKVVEVWYCLSKERLECTWNGIIAELPGAAIHIPGFGSSDCRCRTHLTRFSVMPAFESFQEELKKTGLPESLRLSMPVNLSML